MQGCDEDGQNERLRPVRVCARQEGAGRAALPREEPGPLLRLRRDEHEPRRQLPLLWQQALAAPAPGMHRCEDPCNALPRCIAKGMGGCLHDFLRVWKTQTGGLCHQCQSSGMRAHAKLHQTP